jgi:GDP-mannose 6-dehydrogenase
LQRIAADCGAGTHLVDSLLRSNDAHKHALFRKVTAGLPAGARVLLAGLAFKAETDDLRESPNVDLARMLLQAGYDLTIFDPAVEAAQLVGANLGYVYARIPRLEALLVDQAAAEAGDFDRIIVTNATARLLNIAADRVIDISRLD